MMMLCNHLQTHNYNCSTTLAIQSFSPFKSFTDHGKGMIFGTKRRVGINCFAAASHESGYYIGTKRKVVEHICLLKAKDDLSDKEEKNMLDYLYTSQYHMRGIVAISLGRTQEQNPERYTHGVCMRFHLKEDIAKFYENPLYLNVLKEHVTPHCHDLLYVDFEAEVEDDVLAIFRKGEEFNYGVEFVLLIKCTQNTPNGHAEEAMAALGNLATEFPSLIVQSTQGRIFNTNQTEYTHGLLMRFRSVEAQQIFLGGFEYEHIWETKLLPISEKTLRFQFLVDPVGTELM